MESRSVGVSALYGIITILLVFLTNSLIASLLMEFLPILVIQPYMFIVSFLAYFLGGFVAASKAQVHSVLVGVLAATGVIGITFLIQLFGYHEFPTGIQVIQWGLFLAFGVAGGCLSQHYGRRNSDEIIENGCG
ncbi:hypothetical protein JCM9140_3925 [Halalkalibacter wakoensis JCM 9140]|uniref:Uncharacterized protein n=1 Tax=Halalkalibacter wakoensis JCM 9140 TaxID=1236970 RepID=W4Q6Y4_9BACI|nr:TIGR04086 family membrane protein [Halalkalibacter wakoensis]GAE27767.1 hypothetical protein JCM9140_3925 [Halalkalibacter wakoensis JCM 9140]